MVRRGTRYLVRITRSLDGCGLSQGEHHGSKRFAPISLNLENARLFGLWRRARGSFGANALLTLLANFVLAGIGLATGATVARLLGPHGRGELAAIQTWPMFIGYLSLLGTGNALVYYSAQEP